VFETFGFIETWKELPLHFSHVPHSLTATQFAFKEDTSSGTSELVLTQGFLLNVRITRFRAFMAKTTLCYGKH
jgi:hypothetical protein